MRGVLSGSACIIASLVHRVIRPLIFDSEKDENVTDSGGKQMFATFITKSSVESLSRAGNNLDPTSRPIWGRSAGEA